MGGVVKCNTHSLCIHLYICSDLSWALSENQSALDQNNCHFFKIFFCKKGRLRLKSFHLILLLDLSLNTPIKEKKRYCHHLMKENHVLVLCWMYYICLFYCKLHNHTYCCERIERRWSTNWRRPSSKKKQLHGILKMLSENTSIGTDFFALFHIIIKFISISSWFIMQVIFSGGNMQCLYATVMQYKFGWQFHNFIS